MLYCRSSGVLSKQDHHKVINKKKMDLRNTLFIIQMIKSTYAIKKKIYQQNFGKLYDLKLIKTRRSR